MPFVTESIDVSNLHKPRKVFSLLENYKLDRPLCSKKLRLRVDLPERIIFINDQHIGGCDDLYALDSQGKLDELLK